MDIIAPNVGRGAGSLGLRGNLIGTAQGSGAGGMMVRRARVDRRRNVRNSVSGGRAGDLG